MADLIKSFYEYGKIKESEALESYNEIHSKKIDKILSIDLESYESSLYEFGALKNRVILKVISSRGGNLYPFIFLKDSMEEPIKLAFKNLKTYISKEKSKELESLQIDFEKIDSITNENLKIKTSKENLYLTLSLNGKFFNEIYPEAFENFINSSGESKGFKGYCYIDNSNKIGFDAQLNFCSTNELPEKIATNTKYRLLPLSNQNGKSIKLGFELFFNKKSPFRYRLFGLNYILIPTILIDEKKESYRELELIKNREKLESRATLEEDLEFLIEDLEKKSLLDSMLFTMIFLKEGNNEIVLNSTIEDIAPSRISKVAQEMAKRDISAINISKYIKKEIKALNPDSIYIRDYINSELYLAKLLFGKEFLSIDNFLNYLSNKILFGNNQDRDKRELSKITNNYYRDDTDFHKHQRLIDFFSEFEILSYINLGGDMSREFENIDELIKYRFEQSDILKSQKSKEFYIVGLLSSLNSCLAE